MADKPKKLSIWFWLDIVAITIVWFPDAVLARTMAGRIFCVIMIVLTFILMMFEWEKVYGNPT